MLSTERFLRGSQMSFRKLLISLSLLALMAVPALAQDQTSQTPNAQPQAAQPQASQPQTAQPQTSKDQTAQPQSTQPSPGSTTGSTTSSTPAPPLDPSAGTSPTPPRTLRHGDLPVADLCHGRLDDGLGQRAVRPPLVGTLSTPGGLDVAGRPRREFLACDSCRHRDPHRHVDGFLPLPGIGRLHACGGPGSRRCRLGSGHFREPAVLAQPAVD